MNIYFFKHEILRMFKQKKNFLFVSFILLVMLVYVFFIMPSQQSIYTFDEEKASEDLEDLAYFLKGMEEREGTGVGAFVGLPVYAMNESMYNVQRGMIHAYEDKSYERFLRLYLMGMSNTLHDKIRPLKEGSPYPEKDVDHLYMQISNMYESYIIDDLPISGTMIEQKTALQSLYHFLISAGVFLLLFFSIYFSSDILVKDRKNKSILQGLPISWYRLINLKSVVAICYTLSVIFILTSVAVFAIGIQNGFGSFAFKISTIFGEYDSLGENYDLMTLGTFFLLGIAFLVLFIILFTRLNMVFSLISKNTWVVLLISSTILFLEHVYLTRTSRELFGMDVGLFPQTYFDFGNVITGERMFLLNTDTITYGKGFLVIGITILVVEIILYVMSKIVGKRRFYKV